MEEVIFEIEKETKNTIRYREVEGQEPPKVGTLYIQKWVLRRLNGGEPPKKIKITVEAVE